MFVLTKFQNFSFVCFCLFNLKFVLDLCVSDCYFLWHDVIWDFLNSGPVGLSLMVVLSESYLQNLEKNAIELVLRFDIN